MRDDATVAYDVEPTEAAEALQRNEAGEVARLRPRGALLPRWATHVTLVAAGALTIALFMPFVSACTAAWRAEESYYSHGFLIPLISGWLLWARRKTLRDLAPAPSAWGLAFVGAGLAVHLFADYVYMQTGVGLALVLVLIGVVLFFRGWRTLRVVLFPILFLLFAVPMSPVFTEPISFPMRLMSTRLGVYFLQVVGVPARAAGTLIQFQHFMLVVPNACSGMQSLLSLFAALAAFVYIVEGAWWKKAVLLVCIPPLVVVANAIRLALTGLTAAGLSEAAAQGVVHETTGILVFIIACVALLFIGKVILGLDTLNIDTGPEVEAAAPPR